MLTSAFKLKYKDPSVTTGSTQLYLRNNKVF